MIRTIAPLMLVISALVAVHLFIEPMWLTGDEPRYVSSGLGLYTTGHLQPDASTWSAFVTRSALPEKVYTFAIVAGVPAQSLAPGSVFGLPLLSGGLEIARWLNLAIGCIGLAAIYLLAREQRTSDDRRSNVVAIATLAAIAFSLPFIAYARLLYPEILLLTTVALALYALRRGHPLLAIVAAAILPFEHVRALPLSIAFATFALLDASHTARGKRTVLASAALYASILVSCLIAHAYFYHSLLGPAFASNAPSANTLVARLGIQLYEVRQGVIAYAPIFLIAFAGLAAGTLRGDRFCRRCGILTLVYVATFMWSAAGEAWTGRYWVAALPLLATGFTYWLQRARSWSAIACASVCGAVTLTNTIVYCLHPMWFLQNGRQSISYASIGAFFHVHAGFGLPIDDPTLLASETTTLSLLVGMTAIVTAVLVTFVNTAPCEA